MQETVFGGEEEGGLASASRAGAAGERRSDEH